MNEMDLFFGLIVLMAVMLAVMAPVFPLWFVLHRRLAHLDQTLLREPFFKKSEQINCMVWPFSYWKTLIYICLIAAPVISRKKRFKSLSELPDVNKSTAIASKIQFALMVATGVLFLVYAGYLAFGVYIYPRL